MQTPTTTNDIDRVIDNFLNSLPAGTERNQALARLEQSMNKRVATLPMIDRQRAAIELLPDVG